MNMQKRTRAILLFLCALMASASISVDVTAGFWSACNREVGLVWRDVCNIKNKIVLFKDWRENIIKNLDPMSIATIFQLTNVGFLSSPALNLCFNFKLKNWAMKKLSLDPNDGIDEWIFDKGIKSLDEYYGNEVEYVYDKERDEVEETKQPSQTFKSVVYNRLTDIPIDILIYIISSSCKESGIGFNEFVTNDSFLHDCIWRLVRGVLTNYCSMLCKIGTYELVAGGVHKLAEKCHLKPSEKYKTTR